MDAELTSPRQTRAQHRYELRTLTYLTLDNANGGVVRNITHGGIGAQVVTAVRPYQQLRVRFELRYPRLRVETRAEVMWSTFSGQCGIRFLDLTPELSRQINAWIFGDLLEEVSLHFDSLNYIFAVPDSNSAAAAQLEKNGNGLGGSKIDDGLIVSETPVKVIALTPRDEIIPVVPQRPMAAAAQPLLNELDWLSQPLSSRGLAWTVHTLVVVAGMLLFGLVFLAFTGEIPEWPVTATLGVGAVVTGLYWIFFQFMGGNSLGDRLARLVGYDDEDNEPADESRFR
jgi:PilZ domain